MIVSDAFVVHTKRTSRSPVGERLTNASGATSTYAGI